jgi:hypothetical protein
MCEVIITQSSMAHIIACLPLDDKPQACNHVSMGGVARVCLIAASLLAILIVVVIAYVAAQDEVHQIGEYLWLLATWCRAGPGAVVVGCVKVISGVFTPPYLLPLP